MGRYVTTAKATQYCSVILKKNAHTTVINKTPVNGMSLIELLVVLGLITAMLSFWIMPSYQQWLLDLELKMQAHHLLNSVRYARNIAMQQHKQVLLCTHENVCHCPQAQQNGWVLLGKDPTTQTYSQLLHRYTGLKSKQRLKWHGARGTPNLRFTAMGISAGYNGHFTLYNEASNKNTMKSYILYVGATGRARLAYESPK